jgi:hypothetical protein
LRVKMLRGPQFMRKKFMRAAKYKKGTQNKLNLIKLYTLVIFEVWRAAPTHRAGRVFETPDLDISHLALLAAFWKII